MLFLKTNRKLRIFFATVFLVLGCNSLLSQSANCNNAPFPDQWQIHELESSELPYRSVYILPQQDLDGDGLKDIVTGGWWYKNPGSASGNWQRKSVGNTFNNVAHIHDFDNDGDMDLLGTTGAYTGAVLVWAQNDGSGNFSVRNNIPQGDTDFSEPFLAGIAGARFQSDGPYQMAINWNGAESTGSPVQMLTVPPDPVNTNWSLVDISPDSLGEDLQKGDIDDDGDLDLFQSSNWLRNNGNGTWTTISTGISYDTTPDRAQLADFDGDGDLDAVVGQLSLGAGLAKTEFAWFEAPANPAQTWTKHVLAIDINGSLSVVASDIDFDGDKDIVVGEWKGSNRLIVFQNDLCNSGNWIRKAINSGGTGFDHHDGAQVVNIDNDGDLDIISIGWDNIVPRIFENIASTSNISPIASAGEDQSITLPVDTVTLNGSGSDPDGGSVSYRWVQQNGPNSAILTGVNTTALSANNLVEGEYVFRLTVTDNENDSAFDDVTLTVLAEVVTPLSAQAGATPKTGTAPFEVTFTGSGSTGNIASYSWDFKDGNTSDIADPAHTFSDPGTYEVALTVTDDGGKTDTDTVTINVESAIELIAVAGATPLTGTAPLEVTFTGSGSTGNIASYSWDFKDGNTSDIADPAHTFSDPGIYEVALTVTDDGGKTDTDTVTINVESAIELIAVAEATPLTGTAPLEVTFTSSGSTGNIASYSWDFKDGNTSDIADPVHTFSDPGTYEVALTVTDDGGKTDTDTVTINVESAIELIAVAGATPLTGTAPLEVTFAGSGSTGNLASYSWDFKDGNTSDIADPAHTFSDPGTYEVALTVTDDGGKTDTDTVTINVESAIELIAVAEATPLTGTAPLEVTFTGSGSTGNIASYSWNFKDGNTSDIADPAHTFSDPGTYEVALTVTDDGGKTDTDTVTINVESAIELIAVAGAIPLTGTAPLEVTFAGSGSTGNLASYSWDFKDGNTSDIADPVHTFSDPGAYEVLLTVADEVGAISSAIVKITIADTDDDKKLGIVLESNPAKNGIAILQVVNRPADFTIRTINLYDQLGRLTRSFKQDEFEVDNSYPIPVHTLGDGLYYFKIEIDKGEDITIKLLVINAP